MVKILRKGTVQSNWPLGARFTCTKCDCLYQYEEGDHGCLEYADEKGKYMTMGCPTCGQYNDNYKNGGELTNAECSTRVNIVDRSGRRV